MPSGPKQVRAHFADILTAMKTQLLLITELPSHHVFARARDPGISTHPVQGDRYVVLRPGSPQPIGWDDPAGRVNDGKRRVVEVICRTRLGLDSVDRDETFLTQPTIGHLALEDAVFNALQNFIPEDDAGNILVARGLYAVPPPPGPNKPTERLDPNWGETILLFAVEYQQDHDQSRQ